MRLLPALLIPLSIAAPAQAADRRWTIASFDRLRVEAPVEVRVVTGAGATARASADDPALLARLEVTANGGTLVVRLPGNAVRPTRAALGTVTLTTPRLQAVAAFGNAPVTVTGMRGDRVDLTLNGAGAITVTAIDATQVNATAIGDGGITLAGRAAGARLALNGTGTIDASALSVNEIDIQTVGGSTAKASARYAARIIAAKGTSVTVAGNPRCVVRAAPGATVACGR